MGRLSWLRFLGFDLGASTPDSDTIRMFRERLTAAGVLDTLFADFRPPVEGAWVSADGWSDRRNHAGCGTQQRNTAAEKAVVKEGKSATGNWPDEPAKARQNDTDARWTLKFAKPRPAADGKPRAGIADAQLRLQEHRLDLPPFRINQKGQGH